MAAICSRVTLLSGEKIPSSVPEMMPLFSAQHTAEAYHAPAATSSKELLPETVGVPLRRYSTVTSMARVMGDWGAKLVEDTPWNRPALSTKSMPAWDQSVDMGIS